MSDQLRDQIAEAINDTLADVEGFQEPDGDIAAYAVIDALGLVHVEGRDGEWRAVTAWQNTKRPF